MQHFKLIILFKLLLTFRSPCRGGGYQITAPRHFLLNILFKSLFYFVSRRFYTGSITLWFNMGAHSNSCPWSMLSSLIHPSKNTAITVVSWAHQIFDLIFFKEYVVHLLLLNQQLWCAAAAAVFLVRAQCKIVSGHSVIHPLRINFQHLKPQGEQTIRSTSALLREGESDGGKTHSSAVAWGEINSVWGWATHVCKSTPPRR